MPRRMLLFPAAHSPDPTKAFYQFAAQMRFDKKVKGLSLGQGQGLKATSLIEEASQKGTWVSRGQRYLTCWIVNAGRKRKRSEGRGMMQTPNVNSACVLLQISDRGPLSAHARTPLARYTF